MAARTGTSAGAAGRTLDTVRRLEKLSETAEAWRAGKLSEAQAKEIAAAASANPSASPSWSLPRLAGRWPN